MREAIEEWRDVVGYEGKYEVSNFGRIKSHLGLKERIRKQAANSWGQKLVNLSMDGKQKQYTVHRLVLEAFVWPCPRGMECCHNDGDVANNVVYNLRWDTHSNNELDKVRHGKGIVGEKNIRAKLSNFGVRTIRHLLKRGTMSHSEIAKVFGVCRSCISMIASGKNWAVVRG